MQSSGHLDRLAVFQTDFGLAQLKNHSQLKNRCGDGLRVQDSHTIDPQIATEMRSGIFEPPPAKHMQNRPHFHQCESSCVRWSTKIGDFGLQTHPRQHFLGS